MRMRQMSYLPALILAWALASTHAGAQQAATGIDCTKAKLGVEKEICASPELMRLDAEVATAFSIARQKLDQPARAVLRASQKEFIKIRNLGSVAWDFNLKDHLQRRSEFLQSIRASNGEWAGGWADDNGTIVLTKRSDGLYDVEADATDRAGGRWECSFEHGGKIRGSMMLTVHRSQEEAEEDPHDGWMLAISKNGDALKVKAMPGPDKSISIPFCGLNGRLDGAYLPVNPK